MADFSDLSNRDDWKMRSALYSNGSRLSSQRCEDLTARRILVGLGYTEKGINRLEAELGLAYDPSKPLVDRVRTVLGIVGGDMFSPDPSLRRFAMQCRGLDKAHRTVLDHLDDWIASAEAEKDGAVIVGRVGEDRVAWGYVVLPSHSAPPWLLQPPAVLIAAKDGYWVWYRELSDLVHDMAKFNRWQVPGSVDFDPDDPSDLA